jgi:hypothetical protein
MNCEPDRSSEQIRTSPLVLPWADPLKLAPNREVSLKEAAELSNIGTCYERYPPPEAPPCNDTLSPGESSAGCSMAIAAHPGQGATWLVASAVACGALRRTRRRR